MPVAKDRRILEVLALLRSRFGDAIALVDHWDADLLAVGVVRRGTHEPLVYVRVLDGSAEPRFYVALEEPPRPGSHLPYEPAGEHNSVESAEVVELVGQHLRLP